VNIIGISLDQTMFADGPAIGDVVWRQRQYALALEHLWYVVYALRSRGLQPRALAENLIAYPTGSRTRYHFPLDAYRVARRLIERNRVDLLTTQDPFTTALVGERLRRRYGTPLNVMLFSSFFDNQAFLASGPEARLLHGLGKFLVRRADTVRVESSVERQKLIDLGVEAERIWTIPLLVDLSRFVRADGAPIRALYPGKRLVLYAGRLASEKNLPLLLRAAAIVAGTHPEALFVLVGGGPEQARLEALARTLGLETVRFAGVVPAEHLPAYFAASEVFVLPSVYEGIPTVLIEAAAAGKPIVATPTRNVADVVVPGVSGFVVEPVPETVAERIGFLLDHPGEAAAMGAAGQREICARYDPRRVFADLMRMWEATARARRSAS
jgi:glycosyltransferase involved in cell wall biosynthesis